MEEPREESVEQPTRTEQDAEEETVWMLKEGLGIALVSIGFLLLLALGLLQATGLADFTGERTIVQVAVFGVLALLLLAVLAWSRRGL